jgi:hypothetical protein
MIGLWVKMHDDPKDTLWAFKGTVQTPEGAGVMMASLMKEGYKRVEACETERVMDKESARKAGR